jgi:quercetin dioxygenase-like cupin family protein
MTKFEKIERFALGSFKGGWFIGNFEPSLLKTEEFEVSVKYHPKGEIWQRHFHKLATEYNCVIKGSVTIEDETYLEGDIFVVPTGFVVDPRFNDDCIIVCIKVPGKPYDKYIL